MGSRNGRWLTGVVLAVVGGGMAAVPLILGMRAWLGVEFETSRSATIGVGYLTWLLVGLAISAVWLWRGSRG